MVQKSLVLVIVLIYFLSPVYLSSSSLKNDINEVLKTNPTVQERLKNFRVSQEDLNIAESEYYPKIDLKFSAGYNKAGSGGLLHHEVDKTEYENYESSVTFTQNLFDGFSTMYKIDYQESQILSDAYRYIETANETAFKMADAYIKVLRSQELLQTARENVQINTSIYNKVKELSDSGLTTDSEVKKIHSSLSLAKSKLTVQKNNALEAQYGYRRVLGRMPNLVDMKRPDFEIKMPSNIEEAALFAIDNNPSLIISRYKIKGAEALYKQKQKGFYPKLDFEVSQTYNDAFPQNNGFNSPDDRFQARLILTYNLFRGGSDSAQLQKNISKINQEIELKRDIKRKVIEDLDLAWTFYEMTKDQLEDLREYSEFSEQTMTLYKEEYDLGRRTLLDLLTSQNDVINSREQIIKAEYDRLFAKYRILDAMGVLITSVVGESDEYTSKVNLSLNDDKAKEFLDVIPVKLDADNDNIADGIDLCDNSLIGDNILAHGCKKMILDTDKDGVVDEKDKCPLTKDGAIVSADGCELDNDLDGVADSKDECPNTVYGKKVSITGCEIYELYDEDIKDDEFVLKEKSYKSINTSLELLNIYYKKNSFETPSDAEKKLRKFVEFLSDNPSYKVLVVGHSCNEGDSVRNQWISEERAKNVIQNLIKIGVDASRLSYEGRSDGEPIAFGFSEEDLAINRRIEVEIIQKDKNMQNNSTIKNNLNIKSKADEKTENYKLEINYENNSFKIPSTAESEMQKFAKFLIKNKDYSVIVIGHTSSIGDSVANEWLSKTRAKYITLDLIKRGVEKQRLSYDGKGDKEPISFGNAPNQQALNRRIEIRLIKIYDRITKNEN